MSTDKFDEESEYITLLLKKLGNRLRAVREAQGETSYEKFAFKKDLNRTQIWRYENGEDLKFSSLLKVLKALDISLKDFFNEGFDDHP
jgi:transcriptional regulator with XRE-family HTH domain